MAGAVEPIVIKPTAKHDGTVIFLHGLGDTGHGWSAGFDAIRQPNVKYIFPTASVLPVSLNGGFPMPAWFDIISLDPSGKQDAAGIKKASDQLLAMIDKECSASGLSSDKVAIGGFSQGGAVSLYTAAVIKKPLAAVIALSSWLPLHSELEGDCISHKKTPVLQCHGDSDLMVPFSFGEMSYKLMSSKGMENYSFKKYPGMDHGSSNEEMLDVKKFIQGLFPQ